MRNFARAGRVAARYLARLRLAGFGGPVLDLLARLQVLEGAAGVEPGTFSAAVARGATTPGRRVLEMIRDLWPEVDDSWVSSRDEGVVHKAWLAANKLLARNPHWSADDILMTFLEGRSPGGRRENPKKGAFYMIGGYRSTKAAIAKGRPVSVIYKHAFQWGSKKALDLLRVTRSEFEQHGNRLDVGAPFEGEEGTSVRNNPSTQDLLIQPSSLPSVLDRLLSGSGGRRLNALLENFWAKQGKYALGVMQGWVRGENNRQIAKRLGISEQYTGRLVKKLAAATVAFLRQGRARDLLDDLLEVSGRGLGYAVPKYARSKKAVPVTTMRRLLRP